MATVPKELLEGCNAEDVAYMRALARGYQKFIGTDEIGDMRYFGFESPNAILSVPVRMSK